MRGRIAANVEQDSDLWCVGCVRHVRWFITLLILLPALPVLAQLPPPPVPAENPITEPKRILGKLLFWEEQLSSVDGVACGTCHQPFRASAEYRHGVHPGLDEVFGTDDDVFGSPGVPRLDASGTPVDHPLFGFDTQVTRRAAPTVFNSLWAPEMFFDGRAGPVFTDPQTGLVSIASGGALESQAVGPPVSEEEMSREDRTWTEIVSKLATVEPMALATYLPIDMEDALLGGPSYGDLFVDAFGTPDITAERIAFAIATYQRTLVTNETPFDLGTLTPQQQQGLNVFQSPGARCSVCHPPPLLTDNTFRNIGVRPVAEDTGRQEVTGNPADAGRFKVPGLRNVGLRINFMHNGRKASLEEVVDFYLGVNGQVQFPENQDPLMVGITFPPPARLDLIEFLRNGLTDPRAAEETPPFDRPILASERGDADRDGDVDNADRTTFEACFTGTDAGLVDPGCERLDMNGDADIDCDDWIQFGAAWTEPGVPAEIEDCVGMTVPTVSEWGLLIVALAVLTLGTLVLRRHAMRTAA